MYPSSRLIFKVIFTFLYLMTIVKSSSRRQKQYPTSFAKLATCKEFDIESTSCQHFFPIKDIKNFESEKYKLYLKFYVMTTQDANIVLNGSTPYPYTIVVGGAVNTYSWIRDKNDKTVGLDSHLSHILSPLWPTQIVVRLTHAGELQVAIPNVVDPLLKADAADLDVQSVCLFAWKAESRWFYNCAEDLSPALDPRIQNDTSQMQNNDSQIQNNTSCQCLTV